MGISRRKFFKRAALAGPVAVGGMAAEAALWEPEWLKVRKVALRKGGARVAQFSDVHYRGDADYLRKVVARINSLEPELVCFTGDLMEEAEFFAPALEILGGIRAPLYGIPGNHDFWADADFDLARSAFAAQGGRWLMDETATALGGRVRIAGVTGGQAPEWSLMEGGTNLLLSHYPNWWERVEGARFDLILAGHSHGGQVRLPGIGSLLTPSGVGKFELGLYETAAGPLYVNPGIGYFFANIRFCCRPEITLFEV